MSYEFTRESLRRQREMQHGYLARFLNSPAGRGWSAKTDTTETGRRVMILFQGAHELPQDILAALIAYQQKYVLDHRYGNFGRADCTDVARNFRAAVRDNAVLKPLRDGRYTVSVIKIDAMDTGIPGVIDISGPIDAFKERGFYYHEANLIERPAQNGTEGLCAAIDLTAHYNMDVEDGHNDIFIIVGNDRRSVLSALTKITDDTVRWKISRK